MQITRILTILPVIAALTMVSATVKSSDSWAVCVDDEYEDNDTPETATVVDNCYYIGGMACPNDPDYYLTTFTDVGQEITVNLYFSHTLGDIDLYLLDPNLNLVAGSTSYDDDESLTWTAQQAGNYIVWVEPFDVPPEGNGYGREIGQCFDDVFEDNDDFATAYPVPDGAVTLVAYACCHDDDLYAIEYNVGDQIAVLAEFDHSEGNIDLYLISDSLSYLAVSLSYDDDEYVTWTATYTGTYYIGVVMEGDDPGYYGGNSYWLQLTPPFMEVVPDIKANYSDGPLWVTPSDSVNVTIGLDAGSMAGQVCDLWGIIWWIPFPPIVLPLGQQPLYGFPDTTVFDVPLPTGAYAFFFVIDDNPDGLLEFDWFDYVLVGSWY